MNPSQVRKACFPVLVAGILLLALTRGAFAEGLAVLSHQAEISFDVENHTVRITDRIEIPAGLEYLRLGQGFVVEILRGADGAATAPGPAVTTAEDEDGPYQLIDLKPLGQAGTGGRLTLVYKGKFFETVEGVVFSRENVGGEITATISDEGIYLSSSSEWLPRAEDTMVVFDLGIDTPEGFETVTQGRRTEHAVTAGRLRTRWVADKPSDGVNLIANRYFVHEEPVREGVTSFTFFLEDDARLRATYMERTKAYIAMYEEMIGPYPYSKFATVENWFPTGYGMPSYTLLGGQVLRLPFIPYTSFGHEIAHNWWGNSVYVDIEQGNWCEGLTVYCADYHYKELESDDAAREYRRTLLKDYAAYVKDPDQDFPLAEFKSRHSGATRAVGYGKSMMVFHMVDRMIGRDKFLDGLRRVAAEHDYIQASWGDFMATFAEIGDRDLGVFSEQWLARPGAPSLKLEAVDFTADRVIFTLHQGDPAYDLEVPVVLTTAGGRQDHVVEFSGSSETFELVAEGITGLAVDPDCHLFRRLHEAEIEPTIRQVLSEEDPVFVSGVGTPEMVEAASAFAAVFAEKDDFEFHGDGLVPDSGRAAVVINPAGPDLKALLPEGLVVSGTTVFLEGKRYSLKEFDLVFAACHPGAPQVTDLVILCDSIPRLEALAGRVGHYGKYSWLLLPAGQGRPLRGNWPTGLSPLTAVK